SDSHRVGHSHDVECVYVDTNALEHSRGDEARKPLATRAETLDGRTVRPAHNTIECAAIARKESRSRNDLDLCALGDCRKKRAACWSRQYVEVSAQECDKVFLRCQLVHEFDVDSFIVKKSLVLRDHYRRPVQQMTHR